MLVVLLATVLVVGLRLLGDRDDQPAATGQPREPSPADSRTSSPTGSPTDNPTGNAEAPAVRTTAPTTGAPDTTAPVTTGLGVATGTCDVADVAVVPDVVDAHSGGPVPLRIGLSTLTTSACSLRLSQRLLALELVSGEDLIWRASACPDALEPQILTLRRGWIRYVEVTWNGRRGTEDCLPTNDLARPGYYWAEAAVIGGEPERSQFLLAAPPPPKPVKPAKPAEPGRQATPSPVEPSERADQT